MKCDYFQKLPNATMVDTVIVKRNIDSDEEDLEKFYFYDCVFCKAIFRQKDDLVEHIKNCNKR